MSLINRKVNGAPLNRVGETFVNVLPEIKLLRAYWNRAYASICKYMLGTKKSAGKTTAVKSSPIISMRPESEELERKRKKIVE